MNHELRYAARTDRGLLRSTNQDSLFAGDRLLVVADGMGGHAAGDMASRLVVTAFTPLDREEPGTNLLRGLAGAVRHGNAAIADVVESNPELDGMGTTVTAVLFAGDRLGMAHVGDSRAYLYRNGVLHQLTHDDTFVQSLIDDGRISAEEAVHHPQRSLLLRALNGTDLDPSLTIRDVSEGDRYLLCSDGLPAVVSPEAIAEALGSGRDPDDTADALVQLALAGGGPDNVSVIVADVINTGVDGESWYAADPDATGPIGTYESVRMTQEMPRVPLPGIPEDVPSRPEWLPPDDEADTDPPVDADPAQDDDPPAVATPRPAAPNRGRTWRRRLALSLALVTLAGVAVAGTMLWVRSQYYVGVDDGEVVVYRGVDGSVLGFSLASVQERSCTPGLDGCRPFQVQDLVPSARAQVDAGIRAGTLTDARDVVSRLGAQLLPPCPAVTEGTTGTTVPGSTTVTVPSGPTGTLPTDTVPSTVPVPGDATTTAPAPGESTPIAAAPTDTTTSTSGSPLPTAAPEPGVTCRVVG
ncbi:PP2C family protein-serine/threonine phosphatase [Nakamurella leprariae]|uniref:Serine/threonine protein phosphatase PstP n=1 Tax=Nakamurella leprariae TaxID=2803911 RepID=A0A938YHY3_9ACTN|nr:PP2C family serine/threonine-protein phosphatase [Nakamurella leprariae]MBM9468479.1 serine/threonine-protein phosphatase [Nakamurella leprariae]